MAGNKRLMQLGAAAAQLPLIKKAKVMGCHVIVCDMNPDCPGRRLADSFHQASTTDFDAILRIARNERIDGITTYASDPSAPAVAYVGNALGLPSNPYKSVKIMTQKDKFRAFLSEHGYPAPRSKSFSEAEDLIAAAERFEGAVLVKPSDSSGSRGITKFDAGAWTSETLVEAFDKARRFTRSGWVVLESFVKRAGYQVAGDGFLVDGRLAFRCFANEHFHDSFNPLTPVGESIPSLMSEGDRDRAHNILQSILGELDMHMGALNFDFCLTENGDIFVIEIGPRNGGNMIPEVTTLATGVDMVEYTVRAALGEDLGGLVLQPETGFHSSYVIHVKKAGVFRGVEFSEAVRPNIHDHRPYCQPGTLFSEYDIGNHRLIGGLILKFDSMDEMLDKINGMDRHLIVHIDDPL